MESNESESTSVKEEILDLARKRFSLSEEAESRIRQEALDDLEFRSGEQWPSNVKAERELDGRPCLVINRIPQFIRQITNEQKQNKPAIKISPVDDFADIETAKVLQGIIRHIEVNSNADVAINTAFDGAAIKGLGYFRIVTEFQSPLSFDQEILFKRIRNSFSVFFDPYSTEPDGSDANFAFIVEDIAKDEYKATFKNSELSSMDDWESIGNSKPGWATADSCRVAEYFAKEFREVEILMLSDGSVVQADQFQPIDGSLEVVARRVSRVPIIKWYKINGVEILEERVWPGQWIPVIPVYGDELDVNGERILEGVVRHAKDSQRMYNYWASSETETIALAPRAPWIGAEGQFEGNEASWKTANRKNHAFLEYKPVSLGGQLVGPPQRNVFEPPVQAITNARLQASEDLKATTGIYDAALGARSNEQSGIAIQRRTVQAQTSNFHLIENLRVSIRHAGRILVDLIPKIYDTARAVRIIGDDGQEEVVKINQVFEKGGKPVQHFLSHGKYDVTIDSGPSFATRRQEAISSIIELLKVYPQGAQVVGDLLAKNMDWPGASEIAERLRKIMPPGIAEEKENPAPIPPEIQAQVSQMNQMIEQLTNELNSKTQIIETKTVELESKERIEMAKLQAQIEIKLAELGSVEAMAMLKQEVAQIERRLDLLKQSEPIESEIMEGPGPQMALDQPMINENESTGGFSPGLPMGSEP